jgi:hypothetical protein
VSLADCVSPSKFHSALVSFLRSKLTPMAAVGLSFFCIEFVLVVASCCAFCT